MKRVLFIAEMNGIAKNLNEEMLPHFQVQLCAADKEYTEKLIHIFEPDIVLIFLNQLNHADVRHLKTLLEGKESMPAIIIGSKYEFREYGLDAETVNVQKLFRPVKNPEIVRAICERLGVEYVECEAAVQDKKDRRKHILFVDDNPLLLRSMKSLVSDKYRVSLAVSGAQAFELLQQDRPDLVFLDYEMPGINGKVVLRAIRANEKFSSLPVVMLSAVADRNYIQEILTLKPNGYILKPARQENILAMIDKHVG